VAFQPVTTVKGIAVALRRNNVDTDQIIPAVYMKRITRTGFEDGLFASWRKDPDFVLNRPEHAGANILIAGPDFGTGSSREHAVWALMDYGFRVVISPRFADIFKGNAGKSGLLAIQLAPQHVEQLWESVESHPERPLSVGLDAQTISAGGLTLDFAVDPDTRGRLLNGLDDIDLTLQHQDDITAFERTRQAWLPTTTPK
jgi:3-isopropylmalate/(R)-2-methylmalate dehydratase small subunit